MVQSILHPDINYPERKNMYEEDKNYAASIYDTELLGVPLVIAIGNPIYTFSKENIVYYPIYVVDDDDTQSANKDSHDGEVESQIGVYEVFADRVPEITDEDNDVDISEMGDPLLFSFVTKNYLENLLEEKEKKHSDLEGEKDDTSTAEQEGETSTAEHEGETSTAEHEGDEDEDKSPSTHLKFTPLPEQSEADAVEERNQFKKTKEDDPPWIQLFFHNGNYNIIDNEGEGDCLFASIRDGLAYVGKKMSVSEMRKKLAENATQSVFRGYETMYKDTISEIERLQMELKQLSSEHKKLQTKFATTKDGSLQRAIIAQAEEINKRHTAAQKEIIVAKRNFPEFKFMKGIDTLEAFKAKVQTCDFWGDTWAISTLERVLNIKLILFSSESYHEGDKDGVLNCGQLNDNVLEKAGIFNPSHYILLDYMGYHYKLITYKGRGAFKFAELPLDVKKLVVDKCMERMSGPYMIIPEFQTFMETQHKTPPDEDISQSDLYNNDTVFQFYSKSADKPLPGSGRGEKIGSEEAKEYAELAAIPQWRKKLSNFWQADFSLDGKRWDSVENYYQGSKFKENTPDFYNIFSLDSGSELSKNPALAKAMGGKTGKFHGKILRSKDIVIDSDFFQGRSEHEMERAMYSKFSQNEELRRLLLATKNAKLQHFTRGSPPIIFNDLMRIRKRLKDEDDKRQ